MTPSHNDKGSRVQAARVAYGPVPFLTLLGARVGTWGILDGNSEKLIGKRRKSGPVLVVLVPKKPVPRSPNERFDLDKKTGPTTRKNSMGDDASRNQESKREDDDEMVSQQQQQHDQEIAAQEAALAGIGSCLRTKTWTGSCRRWE